MGKTADRSISGIHDEVVEEEKGGRFSTLKSMKSLSYQKKELSAVKMTGCPGRSPVLMIEVVFLDFEL